MATVYLARLEGSAGFQKIVAIKKVHPHLARNPSFVKMFIDEAHICARLTHPNICQVFDFGVSREANFLVMEFLSGQTVGAVMRRLRSGPQDAFEMPGFRRFVAKVMVDACEGLHAAHEAMDDHGRPLRIVHRDVSPANIFVTYDGVAKIMDFGIAHAAERESKTATGELKGSVAYMAPEQATSQAVDRRTDVWALGVLLWELLSGQRLFGGGGHMAETLYNVVNKPIPPIKSVRPSVPDTYAMVVHRALERDPRRRFSSAREMAQALQRAVQTEGAWPSSATVSEVMAALFPDGQQKSRDLIGNVTHQAILARSQTQEPSAEQSIEIEITRGSGAGASSPGITTIERPQNGALPNPPPARARSWVSGIIAVLAVGVLILVGADAYLSMKNQAPSVSQLSPDDARSIVSKAPVSTRSASQPRGTTLADSDSVAGEAKTAADDADADEDAQTNGDLANEALDDAARTHATSDSAGEAINGEQGSAAGTNATQRRHRSRSAAVSRAPGRASIVMLDGWATVLNRGRKLGQTPLRVELPSGLQTLELRPFGKAPGKRVRVRVRSKGTLRIIGNAGRWRVIAAQ